MKQRSFNKKAYLTTITAITVFCIFWGSMCHLGGLFFLQRGKGVLMDGMGDCSPFDSAEVEIDMGELKIYTGEDYMVSYRGYPEGQVPQWSVKNGTLHIEQQNGMGWEKGGIPAGCSVAITIPEDAQPDMNIQLSMGGMELKNLTLGDMKIDLDMGGLKLTDCSMRDCSVDADMGSIDLIGCSFADGEFDADMGSITLKDVTCSTADCNADMGSIDVSGSFKGLAADCAMGAVNVTTEKGSENAAMQLSADMGKVTVNGTGHGGSYQQ
ncbi:MAG: DUF4097 family beta strand repeat protein [Lachnospiraceae bacterium]|nr:DUF4097 family beta strand repeat protein [Lachnospiraceae bacterium]